MKRVEKELVWLHGAIRTPPFSKEGPVHERPIVAILGHMRNTAMNSAKRKRLESAGWRVGSTGEFLGLTPEEVELVEMKLALGEALKRYRARGRLTQKALAMKLGSSQSRVAKLESGSRGATLDLLFRALFAAGATTNDIAREIGHRKRRAA